MTGTANPQTKTTDAKPTRRNENGSGIAETADAEQWGFASGGNGLSKTSKIGLMLALLLVGAFSFVAYRRLHKQDNLVAQIQGMVDAETDGDVTPAESSAESPSQSQSSQTIKQTGNQAGDGTQTTATQIAATQTEFSQDGLNHSRVAANGGDGRSGSREPSVFSGSGSHALVAQPSSFPTATETRTTEFITSPAESQPDPFAGNGAANEPPGGTPDRSAETAGTDGGSNPFGSQSEPQIEPQSKPATAGIDRVLVRERNGSGSRDVPAAGDSPLPSSDPGPSPFGSQVTADTPTRGAFAGSDPASNVDATANSRSTAVAKENLSNPWDSPSNVRPQQTATRTGGEAFPDARSGNNSGNNGGNNGGNVASSDLRGAVGRGDQGGSTVVMSASAEASTAPWESHPVSREGISSGEFSSGNRVSGGEFGQGESEQPRPIAYVVQSGDNYWRISKKLYGAGRYFTALARYNKLRVADPRRMRPGMQILVPSRAVLESRYPDLHLKSKSSGVGHAKTREAKSPSGFFRDAQGNPMYRVGSHDTLSGIALRHLGRSSRWIQIRGLNQSRLPGTASLKIGTVLQLPADASQVQLVRQPRDIR